MQETPRLIVLPSLAKSVALSVELLINPVTEIPSESLKKDAHDAKRVAYRANGQLAVSNSRGLSMPTVIWLLLQLQTTQIPASSARLREKSATGTLQALSSEAALDARIVGFHANGWQ